MIIKIFKTTQILLSYIPIMWVYLFTLFILSIKFFNSHYISEQTLAFFIISFHAIWICMLITLVLSLLKRKFDYPKREFFFYSSGTLLFFAIFIFDPGHYFSILID
jgi:hypothetical protein